MTTTANCEDEARHENTSGLAVGIATVGRPGILAETLRQLRLQTRRPSRTFVCVPQERDAAGILEAFPEVELLLGPRGSSSQRNTILDGLKGSDCKGIIFFDDDFFPARTYLAMVEAIFETAPEIVMITGTLIADGAGGPGFAPEQGRLLLDRDERNAEEFDPADPLAGLITTFGCYGCNMAVRLAPAHTNNMRFDENLPLYGWLEDIDFSRAMAPFGRIVRSRQARGVHLGVKMGRTSGVRLGYSQIANPVYLIRRNRCSLRFGGKLMARNLTMNLLKSIRPETYVDRRGRLRGNLMAIGDVFSGKVDPQRILRLS
ncbi:MAG: glycosyltransferase family A protein [Pseudomonadota bacterium]